MKRITILAMLIWVLTGCVSTDSISQATTGTIGEIEILDGRLELAIYRDNNDKLTTADLFASNSTGSAKVSLTPENINKLRGMIDMVLNQPLSADTQDKFTTLGIIESYERSGLVLSDVQHNGVRTSRLLTVGMYGIPRLHFNLSREELKQFSRLLVKGITELNKELPATTTQEQPK
jgi:hypothetical protein